MWGGDDMDVDGDINQSTDEDALSDDDSGSSSDVEESEEVRALKVSLSFSGLHTQMIYNYGPQARRRVLRWRNLGERRVGVDAIGWRGR